MSLCSHVTTLVAAATLAAAGAGARSGQRPGPQSSVLLAFHEAIARVVLVESRAASTAPGRASVWVWEGERWTRLEQPGPPVRSLAAGTYDSARKQLVLFGGRVGDEGFSAGDTWAWDSTTWRDVTDASVGIRNHHAMAYDERRGRAVMFGGVITPTTLTARQQLAQRDTWTYPPDT